MWADTAIVILGQVTPDKIRGNAGRGSSARSVADTRFFEPDGSLCAGSPTIAARATRSVEDDVVGCERCRVGPWMAASDGGHDVGRVRPARSVEDDG